MCCLRDKGKDLRVKVFQEWFVCKPDEVSGEDLPKY